MIGSNTMKRWANLSQAPGWLLALASPGAGAFPVRPGLDWADGGDVALYASVAALLAVLLATAGGVLCWRHVLLLRHCAGLRRQLVAEQALRAAAERALRDSHGVLARMADQQRGAREAERRRIGRDIHDDLGQHLLALQLDIGTLHTSPHLPDWIRQQVALIEQHVQLTIRSLRAVINDLRPAALEQGLRLAVQRQLDEFARVSGIRCHLETETVDPAGGAAAAPRRRADRDAFAAAETALFRILQEALSNVLRHACASDVHVALGRGVDTLLLTVRDNGVGLPPGCECTGHGLAGIADRVKAAGGRLTLDSQPGQGTAMHVALPAGHPRTAESHQAELCD
jgi:signal transduction histidine kinase